MLHSGSRGVGNRTAQYYDRVAQERGFADPGKLNHLHIDSEDGRDYLQARLQPDERASARLLFLSSIKTIAALI